MKNKTKIFFVLALLTLVLAVSTVSATDNTNTTTDTTDTTVISDTASESINTEPVQTSTNQKVADTKKIEKEDKNIKTATKNIEVNNYDEIKTAMDNIVNEEGNDTYVINLNEGTYEISTNIQLSPGLYEKNIILNCNNQILTGTKSTRTLTFQNVCNNTLNDASITHRIGNKYNLTLNHVNITNRITNYDNATLVVNSSILNSSITNVGTLIVSEDTIIGDNFSITINNKNIYTNNTNLISVLVQQGVYAGEQVLENVEINSPITNTGKLTFKNCTLNSTITNNGVVIISDDTVFAENFNLNGTGEVIINDNDRLLPLMSEFNGTYVFENVSLPNFKSNYGNLTLINCTLNTSYMKYIGYEYVEVIENIYNEGNLYLYNSSNMIFGIENAGNVFIDNNRLPSQFIGYGNITISNVEINEDCSSSIDYGNNQNFESNVLIKNVTVINCYNRLFDVSNTEKPNNNLNISVYDSNFFNNSGTFGFTSKYLTVSNSTFINNSIMKTWTYASLLNGGYVNIENIVLDNNDN
ncbi:MAG: hypothetical protein BZ136_09135, partial [Methanosphaera sp. rholeuAM74]